MAHSKTWLLVPKQRRFLWRSQANWLRLSDAQRESLDAIAGKVARILNGDPNFADHWIDVAGYATLIVERLRKV